MSELVPVQGFAALPAMTPQEVRSTVEWQAELVRAVLEENVDYGVIRGTPKPSLWKPGAEKLLKAHGFGHHFEPIGGVVERDEHGGRVGVTFRCVVTKPLGERDVVVSTCEGYAGHDESKWAKAPWNTIVKMAQKRALVGATLQATGTSGLLTQDLEDYGSGSSGEGAGLAGLYEVLVERCRSLDEAGKAHMREFLKGRTDTVAGLAECFEELGRAAWDAPGGDGRLASQKQQGLIRAKTSEAGMSDDERKALIGLASQGRTRSGKELLSGEVNVVLELIGSAVAGNVEFFEDDQGVLVAVERVAGDV